MVGFVASNLARGEYKQVHVDDWDGGLASEAALIDVRTASEHAAGAIPGAVNIPLGELCERLDEIPRDRQVVVHCQVGMRGYMAAPDPPAGGIPRREPGRGLQDLSVVPSTLNVLMGPFRSLQDWLPRPIRRSQ